MSAVEEPARVAKGVHAVLWDGEQESLDGLVNFLASTPRICLLAASLSLVEIFRMLSRHKPRLLIVGPAIPFEVLALTKQMRALHPTLHVARIGPHELRSAALALPVDSWIRSAQIEPGLAALLATLPDEILTHPR